MSIRNGRISRTFAVMTGATALAGVAAQSAWAQGCIVGRQCSPGTVSGSNYLMPGESELAVNYRGFTAKRHFNGSVEQKQREEKKTFVINRQNIWDITKTWGVTNQLSASIDIPFIRSSWSVPIPIATTPPGPRRQQDSMGLGDVSIGVKYWIGKPESHHNSNVAIGVGLKLPTGNKKNTDYFPKINGTDIREIAVDQSIQPGDGSLGFPISVEAFKTIGKLTAFGTANYLINPADTNGVPSILAALGVPPPATAPSIGVNSVPDQYLFRLGLSTPLPVKGLSLAVAWRKEGVPAKDLIGDNHGWRRPGFSTSVEPSLSYANGHGIFTISMPVTTNRDRVPTESDGVKNPGDSTFADRQIIMNYTYRFSKH
jgi:hypothetical protein